MTLGGVYSDIDTECLHPIDTWTDDQQDHIRFIVAVEFANPNDWKSFVRPIQLCQ
ncbi:hypothetical protein I4U23_015562 [Adineta vaga]|nr:hypothetical protein I4U23_015562 [Adineta vaga]